MEARMRLTAEEKKVLSDFFERHGLFHYLDNWPHLVCILIYIEAGSLEWGVRCNFAVHQIFVSLMNRDQTFRRAILDVAADLRRQCLLRENSSNRVWVLAAIQKTSSSFFRLRQMLLDAVNQ